MRLGEDTLHQKDGDDDRGRAGGERDGRGGEPQPGDARRRSSGRPVDDEHAERLRRPSA